MSLQGPDAAIVAPYDALKKAGGEQEKAMRQPVDEVKVLSSSMKRR